MRKKATPPHFWILQWVTAALFAGRAWQHLRWDGPYRTLLWDEALMKPFVQRILGMDWASYATDPSTDAFVRHLTTGTGCFFCTRNISDFFGDPLWLGPLDGRYRRRLAVYNCCFVHERTLSASRFIRRIVPDVGNAFFVLGGDRSQSMAEALDLVGSPGLQPYLCWPRGLRAGLASPPGTFRTNDA